MEFLGSASPEPGSTVRATIPLARNYLLAAAGGILEGCPEGAGFRAAGDATAHL